jgi:hypothetical protein
MPGPFRERIFGLLVKIEATSGVDAVPDPAVDAVRTVGIPTFTPAYLEAGTRDDVQNGTLITTDRTTAAGRYVKFDVTLEVKGGGAAGSVPEADALLRICAMSKTVSAGVSVLYTTLDVGGETATCYCYGANKLFKVTGCVAAMKLSANAAQRGLMTFTVTGKLTADPTEAALPALTFSSVAPALFHSAVASIGSWLSTDAEPLVIKTAALDLANTVSDRPSAGATDGLVSFAVTDRKTAQSMTIEAVALATFDPFALSKAAGSATPVSAWQIGTASGGRLKIATGRWALVAPKPGANKSIVTYGLEGTLGAGASGAAAREIALLYD